MEIGKVRPVEITSELGKSYLDYAMSVIVARALPDVKDGLKPVHRRILYAMHQMSLGPSSSFVKSAKIVGEVLGKFHPHGNDPVYEALVRLAQDFSMRYPLVHGQGNFGSVDGDPAAAMRYTEAKLSSIAPFMMADIEKDTVDMMDNFDASEKEPVYLPAPLPNLLLMGAEGIAVGMATKIPPHNLGEVIDAVIATIKKGKPVVDAKDQEKEADFFLKKINLIAAGEEKVIEEDDLSNTKASFESKITLEELVDHIKGPDFPTGGAIFDASSLKDVYATGRGKIIVRGIAEIKDGKRGRSVIEITELPYQVNKSQLVAHIAGLVKDKKIKGIATLRDESDKAGMSVVIEIKRDARPKSLLNNLYKQTKLQTSFPANFVALVDGTPHTVNLKLVLVEYVKHRQKVILRRTIFDLTSAKRRAHILEGLKIALDNLDEVIKTIRASRTQDEAKGNLIKKFKLSAIQSTAILDMQLRRLAALEREKVEKEYQEIKKLIDRLTAILKDPKKVLKIIVKEITEIKEKFGDKRRTKIYKQKIGEFSEEDLVEKSDALITVTKTGYIKRVPRGTYKAQRRGGKGVVGMTTKEEDEIALLTSGTTHDTILFFTDKGRVFGARAWEIPESARQAKGQALVNIVNLDQGEEIMSMLAINLTEKKSGHLIMATQKGQVKKTKLSEFANLRANGLIAIRLAANDSLVSVRPTSGKDNVMLITRQGKSIRFSEKDARAMGRATSGMKGIGLNEEDSVIAMMVLPEKERIPKDKRRVVFRDIITLSDNGIGKRTKATSFPLQKRSGKGVKAAVVNDKTGELAAAIMVTQNVDQLVITSKSGQIIKLPIKNIPQMGRSTQGVILMRFARKRDSATAVTALEKPNEEPEPTSIDNTSSKR